MTHKLTIRAPDDLHLHLRDGASLGAVAHHTARIFARALVMPNLVPPVTTVAAALAYCDRIKAAAPTLDPRMALYLTDRTTPDEIEAAAAEPCILAYKLYPAGATTNSAAGVTDPGKLAELYAAMASKGVVLCVHGEVTDPAVDIFDREAVFLQRVLRPILSAHPALRVVVEHITTADAVTLVREAGPKVGATITPHHLLLSRNALFEGGLRPHRYCLPVLKRERHRLALVEAAISGEASFFAGTDSAPHPRARKESSCGCAGSFTAPFALELYAEVFDRADALDRLEGFMSVHGARFYGLPLNDGCVTLHRERGTIPAELPFGDGAVVPFRAGGSRMWSAQ